ncbi:MAG: tryptophan 2,3-dioxygenase [Planctomycetes bacterium]|nr:tryptophan 2,3-dioxygenase [Planctomycetota bacterium]MBI3833565.1 tryptophan 2,3-dioxygenase [Planctomycetota bacterium]
MPLTYWTYLHLEELLQLQEPRSSPPEHDEMLFIIIHQTYELWFKLLLHELDKVKCDLSSGDLYAAIHTFQRSRTVMKTLVQQVDILETMTPMSFTSFRNRLDTASGFQSALFRELEFVLGYKRPEMMKYQAADAPHRAEAERRLRECSVVDHFYDFLERRGVQIPKAVRSKPTESSNEPNVQVQEGLFTLYKSSPDVAILFELMTDFDEGLQEWRYRHIKLVERTIGAKHGTGGSLGVEFLKQSLFKPVFADLWAIRHRL